MKEVDNVLRILESARKFFEEDRPNELKTLSGQTIHIATISKDGDNIVVAVLVYALGKIMEREHYRDMEGWDKFREAVVNGLKEAVVNLRKDDIDAARNNLGAIRNSLNEIEGDLGFYIKDIFRKAEINKAFRFYEHGLSSEAVAEMLGVSLWDLSSYIGQSHIGDAKAAISMPEKDRVAIAEEIFG